MGQANTTTHLPITKRLYPTDISKPLFERSPFLGLISRDSKFGGEGYHVIVRTSPNTGRGASFERAKANLRATVLKRFLVYPRSQYALFKIEGKLIATTRGNNTAIVRALKVETDSARETFFEDLSRNAMGAGGGSLGQLATATDTGTAVIQLRNVADHINFTEGQPLVFALDDGTGASPSGLLPEADPVVLNVVSVDRDNGTVTVDGLLSTVPGITTSAYIFEDGDTYANSITGLAGWHPEDAPTTGDSHFGVDRSVGDVQRLSGYRYDGSGANKEETLTRMGAIAFTNKARGTHVLAHPEDLGDFIVELGSRVTYTKAQSSAHADIGYEGICVNTPAGKWEVIGDPYQRKGLFHVLNPKRMFLRTTDSELPMTLNEDGAGEILRDNDSDSYVGRLGTFGNTTSEEPYHVGTGTW
jgi:hypothetical protein